MAKYLKKQGKIVMYKNQKVRVCPKKGSYILNEDKSKLYIIVRKDGTIEETR